MKDEFLTINEVKKIFGLDKKQIDLLVEEKVINRYIIAGFLIRYKYGEFEKFYIGQMRGRLEMVLRGGK